MQGLLFPEYSFNIESKNESKKILTSSYSASFQGASLIKDQIMAFLILARVPYLIVDDIKWFVIGKKGS